MVLELQKRIFRCVQVMLLSFEIRKWKIQISTYFLVMVEGRKVDSSRNISKDVEEPSFFQIRLQERVGTRTTNERQ